MAVITVSDTRSVDTDLSGSFLKERLLSEGHELVDYCLVPDETSVIDEALTRLLDTNVDVILINGGTGISNRDGTFETVTRRLEKTLPGFGELFRMLSYQEIGAAAMLSRATAGICSGCVLVSLPGSPAAVRLAWEKLLRSELRHLVREASR
jgi:molybdenum cofactor biosynthesis protein B